MEGREGEDLRELCGGLALSLAPRVIAVGPGPDGRVRAALRPVGLAPDEREALAAAAVGPVGAAPGRRDPAERELVFERSGLERLAPEWPAAALLSRAVRAWARRPSSVRIAGVLNVTPDSFSDGGRWLDPARAVEHALELVAEGADLVDVGGESTRPGAAPVPADEELRRVLPVIEALAPRLSVPLCVDTSKAEVAAAALDAGATQVNDVSAGRADPRMLPLVAEHGCDYVLMHMLQSPLSMQHDPCYEEVVTDVLAFLRERAAAALSSGIVPERLMIDPGIGFGKTLEHNLELLRRLCELRSLGAPLFVGVSRKAFIGRINAAAGRAGEAPAERIGGSAAAVAACVQGGAAMLRVHDVAVMAEAARVAQALWTHVQD